MGLGGGGDSPDTVTHVNRNVPEWVEKAGKEIFEKAKGTMEGTPAVPGRAAVPGRGANMASNQSNYMGRGVQNQSRLSHDMHRNQPGHYYNNVQHNGDSQYSAIPGYDQGTEGTPAVEAKAAVPGKGANERVYQGQRVAGLNPTQNQGLGLIKSTLGKYESEANEAGNMLKQQYGINPKDVTTGRFTDPNSKFNEYVEKVYSPMEKRLQKQADRAMAREQLSNAFSGRGSSSSMGQKRMDALNQQRQDQMAELQAQALNQANQFFQSDEARALSANQGNQAAGLQNKQMNMKGATDLLNNVLSKYGMNESDIARLMTAGQVEQGQNQRELDSTREKWNEMANFDRTEIEWLLKMLGQNPGGTTQGTSTQNAGGSPGGDLLKFAGASVPLITSVFK